MKICYTHICLFYTYFFSTLVQIFPRHIKEESVYEIVTNPIHLANGKPVVEQRLAKVSSKTLKKYKSELDQVVNILRIDDQNVNF